MEIQINKNHKKMKIDDIYDKFKEYSFRIIDGLDMTLFSGAGVLPPKEEENSKSQLSKE